MKTRAIPAVLFSAVMLFAGACIEPAPGPTNNAPIAFISADVVSGNVPLDVAFDGTTSGDTDGTIASYEWAFGDGTTATGDTVDHTYTAAGVFSASLTVTDNGGKTGTASVSITVIGDGDSDGFFPPADCDDADPAINPGAADEAGDDIDSNCDGIDGTVDATFVRSGTGQDTSTCGAIADPCASITQGLTRAAATGTGSVYVAGGSYAKFTAVNGIDIVGGYGQNWQRGLTATGNKVATVSATYDASVGGPVALIADNINTDTRIADLKVVGANAAAGQNSYGVVVRGSTSALTLDSLDIVGGQGGSGGNGSAGSGGFGSPAGNGGNGGDGFEPGGCNTSSAGAGGSGGSGSNNGGSGGKGGVIDGNCFLGVCTSCDAKPGNNGVIGSGSGGGAAGTGGVAGTSGIPGICNIQGNVGQYGSAGLGGANGSAGSAGNGGSAGSAGSSGNLGTNGAGGGGGGGGGGADCGTDDAGAGGGGGGAGGARAATGGGGGAAGAKSIALSLTNSSPTLSGVQITLGTGGTGGNGGPGAAGQPGGAGGLGGAAKDRGGAGGNGGTGGTGGASGAGGGGGGGAAIGISRNAASAPTGTPSFSGGTGGAGGTGGNTGATGTVTNTVVV